MGSETGTERKGLRCEICGEPEPQVPGPPDPPPYYCIKHRDQQPPRRKFS